MLSQDDGDWWEAQHAVSGKKGYIPSNYVAKKNTIDAEPWYVCVLFVVAGVRCFVACYLNLSERNRAYMKNCCMEKKRI